MSHVLVSKDFLLLSTYTEVHTSRHRRKTLGENKKAKSFPESAGMPELSGHCEKEHPASFDHLLNMSPSKIAETNAQLMAQNQ